MTKLHYRCLIDPKYASVVKQEIVGPEHFRPTLILRLTLSNANISNYVNYIKMLFSRTYEGICCRRIVLTT